MTRLSKHHITLTVNGRACALDVEPHHTLVQVLRDQLGLTGTKLSCGEGECGACTVLVDGETVNSCLMLAVEADGREVVTIEGLEQSGELHPVQQAFLDAGAVQCGYCTPGMIMSAVRLLQRTLHPTAAQVKEAMAGNLCRCTGYRRIVQAVIAAGAALSTSEPKRRNQ